MSEKIKRVEGPPNTLVSLPDAAFLALLRCPLCPDRPTLHLTDTPELVCDNGKHTFPFDPNGFPDLRPPGEQTVAPAAQSVAKK